LWLCYLILIALQYRLGVSLCKAHGGACEVDDLVDFHLDFLFFCITIAITLLSVYHDDGSCRIVAHQSQSLAAWFVSLELDTVVFDMFARNTRMSMHWYKHNSNIILMVTGQNAR
jgi:hypothetical protein